MGDKKIFNINIKSRHIEIIKLVKESWFTLFLASICLLVVAGSTAASAYLIKPALDDVFINKDVRMLKLIPIAVILVYFARGLGMYGQEYLMSRVGKGIIMRLRNRLYDHIQDLSLAFFHKETTGTLMSRVLNDVATIRSMVSSLVTTSFKDCFTIVGLVFVIFYQIWDLALFAFIILPLAFYPVVYIGKKVRKVSSKRYVSIADISSFLHETFSGNKIVKAFGMENYEKKRFSDKTLKLFKLEMKETRAEALSSPVMEFLGGLGIAFVIWYGGSRVISGVYTTGTFVSFLAAVVMLYDPVKKISKLNNQLQQGLAAADRIFDIIEVETEIKEIDNPVELVRKPHNVVFDNVSFKYDDLLVLKNINLNVKPGEIIALVGMSGGGKTSLVNLIPRFYDVAEGTISIDGIDIRKVSLASLRDQIAIVTQEPILFNDTVRNNIAYGNWDASDEVIESASKAAYAYDFIQGFPKQFETSLGELGSRLSGGEKQRMCIARALIKDAPILILDEATSALDTESERLVQKALENLMKGRTTFVIAHRLSTIGYANRIVVIIDGRIVEEGKHEELMAKEGEYYKLYQTQYGNPEKA